MTFLPLKGTRTLIPALNGASHFLRDEIMKGLGNRKSNRHLNNFLHLHQIIFFVSVCQILLIQSCRVVIDTDESVPYNHGGNSPPIKAEIEMIKVEKESHILRQDPYQVLVILPKQIL